MAHYEGAAKYVQGRLAVVVSRYNESITGRLLEGALATWTELGVPQEQIDVVWVPGAWELTVVAGRLARARLYSAIVCLGAVIKGETTHDHYINRQVSDGLGRLALEHDLPVLFGLLTCGTLEHAIQRAGGRVGNKGSECAAAALSMANLMRSLPPAGSSN